MLHGIAVSSFLLHWSRQSSWYSSFHMCSIENSEMQNSKTNFYTLANTDLNTTQGTSCTHNLGTLCRQCTHNSPSKHRWKFIGVKLLSSFTNVDINFAIACTTQTWCFASMCMLPGSAALFTFNIQMNGKIKVQTRVENYLACSGKIYGRRIKYTTMMMMVVVAKSHVQC